MRRRLLIFGLAVPIAVPVLYLGAAASADPKPVEFTDARLKVEINATDGDAGLQIFLDGEAWNTVELLDPQGNPLLDVDVTGRAENYGLTELFSESSEPPFTEFPLDQFKELFPEGTYTFRRHHHRRDADDRHRHAHPRLPRRPGDPLAGRRLEGAR